MLLSEKKVLVTGGLGFIGSNLVIRCLEEGGAVTILDNLDPNCGGNLKNIEEVKSDVDLVLGDLTDYATVLRQISSKDLVFNCAASISHSMSMQEPWNNLDVNTRGVLNILEALKRVNRDARFIHLGTTTQLGRMTTEIADEDHSEFPLDVYSANKVASEKYALIYKNAYDLDVQVIRLSNIYGPRAAIHTPHLTFNNYFVGLALQAKPITVYAPGTQMRNLLYVDDAVDALLIAAKTDNVDGNRPVYFATSNDHYSVREIAEKISQIIGGSVDYIDPPTKLEAITIGDFIVSNKKIMSKLGWNPKIDLVDGLKRTKDFFSSRLPDYLPE
tara:strand:+ start:5411 stop:6400 length:990 start_codon:yes stop_codon:yes gene_type:complete